MRVCNVTTPAQYFHVLRRQMRDPKPSPLVLFTPKSLLRFPASFSKLDDLVSGAFQPYLDDAETSSQSAVERIFVSAGKIHYDLKAARQAKIHEPHSCVSSSSTRSPRRLEAVVHGLPVRARVVWVGKGPNMGGGRSSRTACETCCRKKRRHR